MTSPHSGVSTVNNTPAQVHYRYKQAGDVNVFYREAGDPASPVLLMLHGFAGSSFMFRDLIAQLADRYHLIAPDLPAFGFTESPARGDYAYTFDQLAETIDQFTEALGLDAYALMVHDYGAPVGWRLALAHPQRVTAIISQNGNAYEEGLGEAWAPIQKYWADPAPENRSALRDFPTPASIKWQYLEGVTDPDLVSRMATRLKGCRFYGRAMPRSSSIYCWITPRMCVCILSFSSISGNISRLYWRSGENMIRFSCPQVPKPGSVIFRTPG